MSIDCSFDIYLISYILLFSCSRYSYINLAEYCRCSYPILKWSSIYYFSLDDAPPIILPFYCKIPILIIILYNQFLMKLIIKYYNKYYINLININYGTLRVNLVIE